MKNRFIVLVCVIGFLFLFAGCCNSNRDGQVKYLFLFIGDGMGMAQINAAEVFATARSSSEITVTHLDFSAFPVTGLTTTHDAGSFITDSASAGTAIATGRKTLNGVINMDVGKTEKFKSIAEYAHEAGMKVGIVSTVTLNHATPACFYAQSPSRNDYYDIAVQLATSPFDYFGGGSIDQRRGRNNDQLDAAEIATANGFTYIDTIEGFNALKRGAGKVIAINPVLQDGGAMKYDIDRKPGELSLADFTRKGIELLENPKGFFMMVEGGKIDWASHANDAGAVIHDVLALDAAVRVAIEFAKKYPKETLIVVTGDHETGGMSIGFAGTHTDTAFDKIALQTRSFVAFNDEVLNPYKAHTAANNARLADLLPAINESFGIDFNSLSDVQKQAIEWAFQRSMGITHTRPFAEDRYLLYGWYEPLTVTLTQILNQTAGIGWTSYSHTGVPLPVFASGAQQALFGGYYDNTELFFKMAQAMQLKVD
ncbi:MAG: alkaline phosphatase [Treponema sp.]|nr:alkaline phosphatase [Treponema sp.]